MEEIIVRFWENLWSRPAGPMRLRFVFQPIVACVLALIMNHHDNRRELISESWADVGKLFIMACLLDLIFQLVVLRWIYPLETAVVAFILAIVPYVFIRSLSRRIVKILKRP